MGTTKSRLKKDPRCTVLTGGKLGEFVQLADGRTLTIEGNATLVSPDKGQTWSAPRRMCRGTGAGMPSSAGVLLRTPTGVLAYVYMDLEHYHWSWSTSRREAGKNVHLDVWAIRSLDEGRTWKDRKRIFAGYCGALIGGIATRNGLLVVPVQRLVRDPCRHALCVYVSADSGVTWQPSNVLDLGGHGHHDGAMEPTLVELQDGRLWMLIRTNLGRFWEAYSSDQGRSWRVLQPSQIDASSAPGYLLRLASGRLALVWNRLRPTHGKTYPMRGGDGQFSLDPVSWQRAELSLAFSADEGHTWSEPVVVLRLKDGQLSYPYLFEPAPGQLWITTRFGDRVAVSIRESDFV